MAGDGRPPNRSAEGTLDPRLLLNLASAIGSEESLTLFVRPEADSQDVAAPVAVVGLGEDAKGFGLLMPLSPERANGGAHAVGAFNEMRELVLDGLDGRPAAGVDVDPACEQRIAIAAESVRTLRACDVFRVLDSCDDHWTERLRDHVLAHRPDLAREVEEAYAEIVDSRRPEPPLDELHDNGDAVDGVEASETADDVALLAALL